MSATPPDRGRPASTAILIVDDHPLVRRGLTALIESEPTLAVCAEAATAQAALAAISARRPELVIVDLELGEDDGLALVREIKKRYPDIPSLVLSMHDESVYAERSLRAGALGYVNKRQFDGMLLVAIRCVLDGRTYLSEKLKARFAEKYVSGRELATDSPLDALSDRELQVFRLIGQGRSTRQIAETLGLSIKTIESHREHIKQKMTIESSAELAQRATQWVETGHTG